VPAAEGSIDADLGPFCGSASAQAELSSSGARRWAQNAPVNLTVAAVFAAHALIYVPRFFVLKAQADQPEGLDNGNPRAQQAKLSGLGARALGAHNNSFEDFAPFAAAALCASLGPLYAQSKGLVDGLAWAHIAIRLVYLGLYLGNIPTARTLVWICGAGTTGALFYFAMMAM
jgi:uncharacterized MAPEG superfamily protein